MKKIYEEIIVEIIYFDQTMVMDTSNTGGDGGIDLPDDEFF